MHEFPTRSSAIIRLCAVLLLFGILQACQSLAGTHNPRMALRVVSPDTCPKTGESAPPAGLLTSSGDNFISYAEGSLRYVNDPHLSNQTVLLQPVGGSWNAIGNARIEAERCSHRLSHQDLDGGRIIARIISDAAYSSPTLTLRKGIQYVWVEKFASSPHMRILYVDPGNTTSTVQVIEEFNFTPANFPHLVDVPGAAFYRTRSRPTYDALYFNGTCSDQCCPSGGTRRDSSDTTHGPGRDMMQELLNASDYYVRPGRRADKGVPPQ